MATQVSPSATVSHKIRSGVAPLRAGEGHSFLWRRLHSISGIFPVGAFLIEHYISNAYATNGVHAYNEQVRFLTSLPFVIFLETFFIYIPLLYHSIYGFYIWYRGNTNVASYPWLGNWMYTAQRWTGGIAFIYMFWHVYTMRFTGVHLITNSAASFTKVYNEFSGHPLAVAAYFVGITAASWHFGYGIWLFCSKWGITVGASARRKFGVVCFFIALAMAVIGYASMYAFLTTPASQVPAITAPATE